MKRIILLLTLLTAAALAQPLGSFTDSRDGKTYRTVKIGAQVWMAENLQFEAKGSKCYDNKVENCKTYGRLYDWKTALKVCPSGWHLPKNEEWDVLYKFVDNSYVAKNNKSEAAGKYLKAKSGYKEDGNGIDKYGFAALPGGYGAPTGVFNLGGYAAIWWSASEHSAPYSYSQNTSCYDDSANRNNDDKTYFQSVRCVRD